MHARSGNGALAPTDATVWFMSGLLPALRHASSIRSCPRVCPRRHRHSAAAGLGLRGVPTQGGLLHAVLCQGTRLRRRIGPTPGGSGGGGQ